MTSLKMVEYTSDRQIAWLAELADEIWHECFPDIISDMQIDYMVEKFQSFEAMKHQIAEEGYHYFAAELDGIPIGYYAVCKRPGSGINNVPTLFISKLYLRKEWRGKGIASIMYREIKRYARKNGCELIKLTCNKRNTHAISVYKHIGMVVIDETVTDIGGGFVMDDYVFGRMI